jgi:hypothetical protein
MWKYLPLYFADRARKNMGRDGRSPLNRREFGGYRGLEQA